MSVQALQGSKCKKEKCKRCIEGNAYNNKEESRSGQGKTSDVDACPTSMKDKRKEG